MWQSESGRCRRRNKILGERSEGSSWRMGGTPQPPVWGTLVVVPSTWLPLQFTDHWGFLEWQRKSSIDLTTRSSLSPSTGAPERLAFRSTVPGGHSFMLST